MGITYTVVKKEDLDKEQQKGNVVKKKDGFSFEVHVGKKNMKYSAALNKALNKSTMLMLPSLLFFLSEIICETLFLLRLEDITNYAFEGNAHKTGVEISKAIPFLVGMLVLGLVGVLFQSIYTNRSVNLIKRCITQNMMQLHPNTFKRKNVADYVSFLTNTIRIVENNYLLTRYNVVTGMLQIIAGVVISISVDWRLLLVSAIIVAVLYAIIAVLMSGIGKRVEQLLSEMEFFTAKTREFLCAFHIIKVNNLVDNVKGEMGAAVDAVQEKQRVLDKKIIHIGIIVQLLVSSVIFLILSYTIIAVMNGTLTVGEIVFLFSAFAFVLIPGISVLQILPNLKEGTVALKELDDWCFAKDSTGLIYSEIPVNQEEIFENSESVNKAENSIESAESMIEKDAILFEKVCFDYGKGIVVDKFSFCFEKGKKYMIIGESGSVKTTLLKLMLGLLRPNEGNIYLNGQKYETVQKKQIQSALSYLPQTPVLFNDTILNNICLDKKQNKEFFTEVINR